MKIQVFDPPMCCSSGVCGPSVDPELVRFSADLDWIQRQGVEVERYNLAQQPDAFASNPAVRDALAQQGNDCLPLTIVNGTVVLTGRYPTREELTAGDRKGFEPAGGVPLAHGRAEPEPADVDGASPLAASEVCGPSCACQRPPANRLVKNIIFVAVVVAAAGILAFKLSACSKATSKEPSGPARVMSVGEPLSAFGDLSALGRPKDASFVLILAPGTKGVRREVAQAISAAGEKLEGQDLSVGLYTLSFESPDYSSATLPQALPAVFLFLKGGGKEAVTGDITEAKLLQSYVALSRASSPGGCNCGHAATCGGGG